MKPWSAFYNLMSPDVPDCPQSAQNNALLQASIAFCEQSLAWKYDHPDIAVVVDTAEYPFEPPAGAVVHVITYAEFNGKEISASTAQDDMRIWDWRNQPGTPEYALGGPLMVTLVPMPNVAGTLKLEVSLKPSPIAEGIDDNIFNEYREAIIHGALAQLMMSQKKPYSNPQLSAYHMQQFFIKTGAAGNRVARNYTRAPLQTSIMRRR